MVIQMEEKENVKRMRKEALMRLQDAVKFHSDWKEPLWEVIRLHQGVMYHTTGRVKIPPLPYQYQLKVGLDGKATNELIFSRKENSKTITRSTVELGFQNGLSVQAEEGCVKGPKRLKVFGASYLYPMFLSWGIITREADEGQMSLFHM